MCQVSGEGDRGSYALAQSSRKVQPKSSYGGAQVKAQLSNDWLQRGER